MSYVNELEQVITGLTSGNMINKDKHLNPQLEEKHHGKSMERGGLALRLLVVLKAGKLVESFLYKDSVGQRLLRAPLTLKP